MSKLKKVVEVDRSRAGSNDNIKDTVIGLQRWVSLLGVTTLVLAIATGSLSIAVAISSNERVETTVAYVNDDQVVTAEPSHSSIPSIFSSQRFVEACLKHTYSVKSTSYKDDMIPAGYCYQKDLYDLIETKIGELMSSYFLSRRVVGGFEVRSVKAEYSHDNVSVFSGNRPVGCAPDYHLSKGGAIGCRTYRVKIEGDFVNYQDVSSARVVYEGRVDVVVGSRASMPNGMYIGELVMGGAN